eukprot:Hpha_TRINITY_DN14994_c0_g1::TRINITY_DN14994_c0_g1_i2::g.144637::m.144637
MGGKDADSAVQYAAGEQVWVFYRFEHGQGLTLPDEYESYFPVQTSACALKAPRTSKTDGWMRAVVAEEYPSPSGKPSEFVRLRPLHRLWGNRKGSFVDLSIPSQAAGRFIRARVACVRRDPPPPPSFSFLVLRWGIWTTAHDGDGEWGGWGQYGSCVCDKYIKGFFTRAFERMGATYEVLTCFVHQSADIRRLQPESLVARLATHQDGASGKSAALYYLWPVAWLDGHGGDLSADDLAGYVEREALLGIMQSIEATGVPTRHPHPSNLYRLLCSKDWSAHLCLTPQLHVPATTKVNRALVLSNPLIAARGALSAVSQLLSNGSTPVSARAVSSQPKAELVSAEPFRGVVKLGFAWEAREVYHFKGEEELAEKLTKLLTQPGNTADSALVQEFVPHDCEIRVYCIHGKPVKMLYTKFQGISDTGSPQGFRSLDKAGAAKEWFKGDDALLDRVEDRLRKEMVPLWLRWLLTESSEVPSAVRMDFFVQSKGSGCEPVIMIGELTEQGASTLGWDEGPEVTFDAVIDVCTGARVSRPRSPSGPERKRQRKGN